MFCTYIEKKKTKQSKKNFFKCVCIGNYSHLDLFNCFKVHTFSFRFFVSIQVRRIAFVSRNFYFIFEYKLKEVICVFLGNLPKSNSGVTLLLVLLFNI